jgi:N-ethylmaleimide reductase
MTEPTTDLMLLSAFASNDGKLATPNRVAMAPMTRNRAGEERCANALMATYYSQRASAGLLISESVDVSPGAIGYPGTPGFYNDAQEAGWREVVAAVREAQEQRAPFFCQLFHTGRVSHVSLREGGVPPYAPSAVQAAVDLYTPEGMQQASMPHALTTEEVEGVVAEYVAAARRAMEAGFDGIEVNAGNGYLVDQFLRDKTNKRTDRYGGTPAKRAQFLLDIVDAVSEAIGSQRVAVRISPLNKTNDIDDSDPTQLFTTVADALETRALAYLHVIEAADKVSLTPLLRERFSGTMILNDGYDKDRAEAALRDGLGDLVSFGRLFIANPDLPKRFALGSSLNEPDPTSFYGGTEVGYTSYPVLP